MATPQPNVVLATETLRDEIVRRRQQMARLHRAQQERNKKQTQPTTRAEDSATVLSPLAVSILGMEGSLPTPTRQRQRTPQGEIVEVPEALIPSVPALPVLRTSRRAQSHYNTFQTSCSSASDGPPSYATAIRHRPTARHQDEGREVLPKYTCSVSAEARLLLNLESIDPLHTATEGEWREMYVMVRGTMLSIYRLKDGGPGKFLRSYTLQHAEVGLAIDASHTVLVPQSRIAHFIPSAARNKAWKKDPHLFRAERQTILRLRVETDQFLLADPSEERIFQIINAISAGIDIAPSLDERSVPRQCTVPRRRRRTRPQFNGDITDQSVIAEQERILQQMYPAFAEQTQGEMSAAQAPAVLVQPAPEPPATPAREEDEIDLSAMREDIGDSSSNSSASNAILTPSTTNTSTLSARPAVSRTTTSSSVNSTFNDDMLYESPPTNFTSDGKWRPPHTRTEAQILRYTRRCMPIMSADSVRASDVLISNGKRVKINWRMEMLEEWELKPPSYKSHNFPVAKSEESATLERTASNASSSKPAASTPASSRDNVDEIAPVESGLAELDLSKTRTVEKMPVGKTSRSVASQAQQAKASEVSREDAGVEAHGVVFCF